MSFLLSLKFSLQQNQRKREGTDSAWKWEVGGGGGGTNNVYTCQ
jgi:hypothetical protein